MNTSQRTQTAKINDKSVSGWSWLWFADSAAWAIFSCWTALHSDNRCQHRLSKRA